MKIKHYMPVNRRSGLWKIQDGYYVCLQNFMDEETWGAPVPVKGNEHEFIEGINFEELDRNYYSGYAVIYIDQLKKEHFYDEVLNET